MSSFIILQLKVNNKEKVDKHPSTDNSNNLDKESPKKKKIIPWSAVIYSDMGLYCSEYHTIISVSQSTLTRSHTHSNYTPAHRYKCTHTPWTIKADRRDYNRTAAPDKSIL